VFPSLCLLKSRGEDFKSGFQIFQFSLNFIGTKTYFAEIFHNDIHEAQIFEIRGFRSTLNRGQRFGSQPRVATERMRSETAPVSEPVYDYSDGKHGSKAPIKSLIPIKDSRFVYKDADNKSLVVVEGT